MGVKESLLYLWAPPWGDSATRWQWPPNNVWPEAQGPGGAFVQLFAP